MSAAARVAIFVALLAAIFVVAALAGRAVHPRAAGDAGAQTAGAHASELHGAGHVTP